MKKEEKQQQQITETNDQHLYFKLLSVNTLILQELWTDSDEIGRAHV